MFTHFIDLFLFYFREILCQLLIIHLIWDFQPQCHTENAKLKPHPESFSPLKEIKHLVKINKWMNDWTKLCFHNSCRKAPSFVCHDLRWFAYSKCEHDLSEVTLKNPWFSHCTWSCTCTRSANSVFWIFVDQVNAVTNCVFGTAF